MGQQHAALLIYDKWMTNEGKGRKGEGREGKDGMDNEPQRRDNEQRRMANDKDNANDSADDNENENDNGNDNDNGNESAQRIMRCPIMMTIASCDCRLPIADCGFSNYTKHMATAGGRSQC